MSLTALCVQHHPTGWPEAVMVIAASAIAAAMLVLIVWIQR